MGTRLLPPGCSCCSLNLIGGPPSKVLHRVRSRSRENYFGCRVSEVWSEDYVLQVNETTVVVPLWYSFTLPASSERVRAPSAKIQKRQRSGRVLRRRQSSQTQVESIPRSRRSLPADSSADAEKALQEELGEVLHPQPPEVHVQFNMLLM